MERWELPDIDSHALVKNKYDRAAVIGKRVVVDYIKGSGVKRYPGTIERYNVVLGLHVRFDSDGKLTWVDEDGEDDWIWEEGGGAPPVAAAAAAEVVAAAAAAEPQQTRPKRQRRR